MCCCGTKNQTETKQSVTDVVCGMQVDPATAGVAEYQGKRYFFCGVGCKRSFEANPAEYASSQTAIERPGTAGELTGKQTG